MSNFLNVPTFKSPLPANVRKTDQPSGSATGNPRNKTALKPGRSLMDWVRLSGSGKDLAGTRGRYVGVTPSELRKHDKIDDAWMCLRGKVYNVTPYMEFHPGGIDELMRGVGTDATQLFDDVHQWVNYESMLAKCLIGPLVADKPSQGPSPTRKADPPVFKAPPTLAPPTLAPSTFAPPPKMDTIDGPSAPERTNVPVVKSPPRFEWFQTDTKVNVVLYTRWKGMRTEFVVIHKLGDKKLQVLLRIEEHAYCLVLQLDGLIASDYDVNVSKITGKVSIDLHKVTPNQRFTSVTPIADETQFTLISERKQTYIECTVQAIEPVTHDTNLYCIAFPEGSRMIVPLGHHVQICEEVLGMKIARNYTVINKALDSNDPLQQQGKCIYLMIKLYDDGALTPIIGRMRRGDGIHVSDTSLGNFNASSLENKTELILFAAGTGFTPMANLIHHLLAVKTTQTPRITLVFFNKEVKDILWKTQLDTMISQHPERFQVHHVLSQPHSDWKGHTGRVRKEIIQEFVPQAGSCDSDRKLLICACGPTPFTETVMALTKELGHSEEAMHAFLG